MNEQHSTPVEADGNRTAAPLVERMDPAIGEATSVMGAMLTELLRRTLRGGVRQVGEVLEDYALEKVDSAIVERTPELERIAGEVADKTARTAATEVAVEEVRALEDRTRQGDDQLAARIDETARNAEQLTHEKARELGVRIEEVDKKAEETTVSTARDLTGQIHETERRVSEAFQAEVNRRVQEVLDRSHKGAELLRARLQGIEKSTTDLGQQLTAEQAERKAGQDAVRAEAEQRAAELRKEVARLRKEAEARMREEVERLREANQALAARVAELEKPRGLRRLWLWIKGLFSRRPAPVAKEEAGATD